MRTLIQHKTLFEWASSSLEYDAFSKVPVDALYCHYAHYVTTSAKGFPYRPKTFVTQLKAYLKQIEGEEHVMFKYERCSWVYGIKMPNDSYGEQLANLTLKNVKELVLQTGSTLSSHPVNQRKIKDF